ncbi:hypothetical protein ACO3VM_09395 (plasmid) [Methanocaldococcus sp. 10A]
MYGEVECKRIGKGLVSWYYDGHIKSWIINVFREDLGKNGRTRVFRFGKKNGEKVAELLKFLLDENLDSNDDYDDW